MSPENVTQQPLRHCQLHRFTGALVTETQLKFCYMAWKEIHPSMELFKKDFRCSVSNTRFSDVTMIFKWSSFSLSLLETLKESLAFIIHSCQLLVLIIKMKDMKQCLITTIKHCHFSFSIDLSRMFALFATKQHVFTDLLQRQNY